jgi:hypothetical protein
VGFDINELKAEKSDSEARKKAATQRAYDLLIDYVRTAGELNVQPQAVEAGSLNVQAAGIAMASWPKSSDRSIRYFPLVLSARFDHHQLAAESQGLSVTPDGSFYFEGKPTEPTMAAAWLASVCDFDADRILEVLKKALQGSPEAVFI